MHIVVNHHISNPDKFWEVLSSNPEMPESFKVKSILPGQKSSEAVCIWQAPNQQALKDLIDGAVGEFCSNTFMEVNENEAIGL